MKNIKNILAEYIKDEEVKQTIMDNIDFEGFEEKANEEVNRIVAKNKPDEEKLKSETTKQILSELGVEGETVEDAKKHIEQATSSTDEYKSKYEDLAKEKEELEQQKSNLETQFQTKEQMDKIKEFGVKDNDRAEFIHYKVGKMVDDDTPFEDALTSLQEESPDLFKDQTQSNHKKLPKSGETDAPERDIIMGRRNKGRN